MTPKLKLMKLQLRNTHTLLTRPTSMTWRQSVVSSAATESAWTSSGPISPGERRGCGRPERLRRCLSAAFCSSLALEPSGEHKLLLAVHITDRDGRTPLAEARNQRRMEMVRLLGKASTEGLPRFHRIPIRILNSEPNVPLDHQLSSEHILF
jgi:ribonuclease PH